MDSLYSFLYQFLVGGMVLLAGMFGAIHAGSLHLSSKNDRLWIVAIFFIVAAYAVVQGVFQFIFSAS